MSEEEILGWINMTETGKAIKISLKGGATFFVPISMMERFLRGQIKGIPLKKFSRGKTDV